MITINFCLKSYLYLNFHHSSIFYFNLYICIYSQSFVPAGSASMDSANHKLKTLRKKIPESFQKQNLNLSFQNYLHSIYIVFTTIYIDLHCIMYYK